MRSKNTLYKKEQLEIVYKLVNYIDLNNCPVHILHDLDQNNALQENIMKLSPDIKKYYNCNNLKAVTDPSRIKRPWLSIIKTLLKPHYFILVEDYHFTQKNPDTNKSKYIHTQKYTFTNNNKNNNTENDDNDGSPCGVNDI